MPRVFLSPCGTSILTNNIDNKLRQLLMQTANCKEEELTGEQKQTIDEHIQKRRQQLLETKDLEAVKKLSAELHGLIAYYDGNLASVATGTPDQHFLLVSNTYLGSQVANIVAE